MLFARPLCRHFGSVYKPIQLPPTIKQILESQKNGQVSVTGYVKSVRRQKNVSFAVISDGSTAQSLQAVFVGPDALETSKRFNTGSAIRVSGRISETPGRPQPKELLVDTHNGLHVLGGGGEDYPLQKKSHTHEFLRDWAHLRARTDTVAAMLRFRHDLRHAVSAFFKQHQFVYVDTPVLTGNDAEGAGETFSLAPVPPRVVETRETGESEGDFFSPPAHLTVSAQLHLEAMTQALGRTWVLGPCFRAERSATRRHLAEFWMLEAEWVLPPCDSTGPHRNVFELMAFTESLVRQVTSQVLEESATNIKTLSPSPAHTEELGAYMSSSSPWTRMSYTEAIDVLSQAAAQGTHFDYPPQWGCSLQTEHEKWLCEQHTKGPLFVYDYPRKCKSFYMKLNDTSPQADDKETVACFDLLLPSICELAGGSVREDRLEVLDRYLGTHDPSGSLGWYRDLRKFGGLRTGGFGIGFERWVSWVLGIENVRDCVGIPRSTGRLLM